MFLCFCFSVAGLSFSLLCLYLQIVGMQCNHKVDCQVEGELAEFQLWLSISFISVFII